MIRRCFSRLSSISLLYTLFAVVFSLLITVGAHPVAAAAGDLDTSFDSDGKVTTAVGSANDEAYSVAIQSDGKIVVAGYSYNGSKDDFALVRYNTDGSLDTSFDSDGKVTTDVNSGSQDHANSVAIQSDGKIVAAGFTNKSGITDFALVRYNTDGSLDTSFDSDGKVTTAIGGSQDHANSVAIQADGKIVVAGYSMTGGNRDLRLVRYNTDGSLDTSFDSDGKVTTAFGEANDEAYSVAIQSDGKIVVAGFMTGSNTDFALVRYNTDGSLDTSFDSDGKVTTEVGSSGNDRAYSVAIQSDGKIVAAGLGIGSNADFALVRYNTDGSLDTSFDSDGKVTTAIGSANDWAYSVAIQSDGKIVAAGFSDNGSNFDFALLRYNTDGSLDTNFDSDGKVTTAIGSGNDMAYSVAIQADGKIVAAGYSKVGWVGDFALVRYLGTSPPATPPATPSAPTATSGNGQATVTWSKPADGGSTITGYTVTSAPDGRTCSTSDADTLSCVVTGLTNGTAYTFTVTATNDVGTSTSSSASNSVTPVTTPSAPSAPTATSGNGQATVTWSKPADGGSTITGYTVTSSPDGRTCSTNNADTLSCVVTGLTNGTAYTFTVTATNDVGTSTSSSASNSVTPELDSDGDGVKDDEDAFPNDPNETADSDGDGVGDYADLFPNAVTERTLGSDGITLKTTPSFASSSCNLDTLTKSTVGTSSDGVATNGSGVGVSFTLSGCQTGAAESLTISIDLGSAPAMGSVAMKIDANGDWSPIEGATIQGSVVTYTLADNGPLDQDLESGKMDDPVTVAVPYVPPSVPAPAPAPVPTLPLFGLGILVSLLGLFGLRKLRQ